MSEAIPAIALAIPAAGAIGIALTGRRPNLRESITMVTAVALFGVVATLIPGVLAGERPAVTLVRALPAIGLTLRVEPLGLIYALVASFLWIFNSIYSIGYMRSLKETGQTRYYVCFAVALASTIGIAFAANLLTLFVFYEALTFSTYPLVTHKRSAEAVRAGRFYLAFLVGTSTCLLLLAILWTWSLTGTIELKEGGILAGNATSGQMAILLALFFLGTGKTAIMPFHFWLPKAMIAPTPVSALLHAVAVVKAGVFIVLKVSVYVFGLEQVSGLGLGVPIAWLAAATILIASLIALAKDNLKARLAYSTISQLSYIVLAAALGNSLSILGGSMHIAMHAFGKITLFFCAGAIYVATKKTQISEMAGIGRTMPWTMTAFLIGALSTIGLPPLGGAWSKWYLALGTLNAHQITFLAVLLLSSLLNVAYLLPIVFRAFYPRGPAAEGQAREERGEAPLSCLIPLMATAAGCLVLFLMPGTLYELARRVG